MKKIFFFCALLVVKSAMADVAIINNNKVNDMDVSYRYCHYDSQTQKSTCTSINTVTIKADLIHHIILHPPGDADSAHIISAVEKDINGKVIAQGNYLYGQYGSNCGYPLVMPDNVTKINAAFILNDVRQSPIITCMMSQY